MPTLTVAMIVKNEARCLGDCLESVRAIADEIVVADTGSTDDTMDVARRFDAKVLQIEWHDDFAEARNRSLDEATGDWLLHLDADEMLDPEGAARIRAIVDADGAEPGLVAADAIEVTLANYCDEPRAWRWTPVPPNAPMARGFSGYIAVGLLRLFRNGRGYEYREPIHENITESVLEAGGRIRTEPIVIHHYGYGAQSANAPAKARLYLDIGRKKARQRPQDPKAWHDLAEQLAACGHVDEAEQAARKAIALDPHHLAATTTLANLLLNRGDLIEARSLLEGLDSAGITPPHVATALGAIACKQGRLSEARERLADVVHAQPRAVMAHLYLARTLDCLGEVPAARAQLERIVAEVPALEEARQRLEAHRARAEGEALFQNGEPQRALEELVRALKLDPEDPLTQNDIGVVLLALGETEPARRSFERALLLAPGLPEARDNLRQMGASPDSA